MHAWSIASQKCVQLCVGGVGCLCIQVGIIMCNIISQAKFYWLNEFVILFNRIEIVKLVDNSTHDLYISKHFICGFAYNIGYKFLTS